MASARKHPLQGIFDPGPWPRIDTRPLSRQWGFSPPAGDQSDAYARDCETFARFGPGRNAFIRHAPSLPEMPGRWDATGIPSLDISTLVLRVVPGWHFELPFWRGPARFPLELATDAEVMAVVTECVAIGGYDEKAVSDWQSAVARASGQKAR